MDWVRKRQTLQPRKRARMLMGKRERNIEESEPGRAEDFKMRRRWFPRRSIKQTTGKSSDNFEPNPEDRERADIVKRVSAKLQDMIDASADCKFPNVLPTEPQSIFYSKRIQKFTVEFYVQRLADHMDCSSAAFVLALMYIETLLEREKKLQMNAYSVHRLLLTALVLAAKFIDDSVFSNAYYASVGGIATVREMNAMEAFLLRMMDYRLFINSEEFQSYEQSLGRPPALPSSPISMDSNL